MEREREQERWREITTTQGSFFAGDKGRDVPDRLLKRVRCCPSG